MKQDRYHALDFLRAFAMLLGIGLHGVLPYTATPVPFWPVHDRDTHFLADVSVFTIHEFRMQTFFFLAGFFGCLLYQRYHLGGMTRHRFLRLVLPLVLALLIIQPILQAIWMIGEPSTLKFVGLPVPEGDTGAFILNYFTSGAFFEKIRPYHLWFLYYLILLFALVLPVVWVARGIAHTRFAAVVDSAFRRLAASPWKAIVLAVPLVPLLWNSRFFAIDTPESWPIHWEILGYYAFFFGMGWMLYRHRELLTGFAKRWRTDLLVGNLLILPIMLGAVAKAIDLRTASGDHALPLAFSTAANAIKSLNGIGPDPAFLPCKAIGIYFGAVYSWMMVSGLTGAFLHWFNRERAWVRYLADSAYWCYLVHLIPVVLLQMAVAPLNTWGSAKFVLVLTGSMAILLLTYQVFVRYTVIGTLLNGKRLQRATRTPAVEPQQSAETATAH